MSSFALAFREKVHPDLLHLCQQEAIPVAWETKTFTEGWSIVMREARRRGADHLPDQLREELDVWICRTISTEVEKYMPDVMKAWRISEWIADGIRAYQEAAARWDTASAYLDGALGAFG